MGNWFGRRKDVMIVIQGLDAAGKTSLLYKMKLGEITNIIPTIGMNIEMLTVQGIQIQCWDVGGRGKIRPLYRHFYKNTAGYIFVVDSHERERVDDALDELVKGLLLEEETHGSVVMVLANKQDLPGAMTASDIYVRLQTKYKFTRDSTHTVFVMPCSVTKGDGLREALNAFVEHLARISGGRANRGLLNLSKCAEHVDTTGDSQSNAWTPMLKFLMKDPVGSFKSFFH